MKKLLLSCFLALGIGASAQYNVIENFDVPSDGRIFFGNGGASTTVFCSGTTSWAANISAATGNTQIGYGISFADKAVPQTTTGQKVAVSVNYRKTTGEGTLYLAYYVFDPGANQWSVNTFASKALTAATVTTCTSFAGTIPAGVLDQAALAPGAKYAIGTFFVRSGGTGVLYIDDLSIVEEVVTTAPACTTFTNPTSGAVVSAGQYSMSWAAAPTATKYQLKVGTTSGGSDVFNGLVSGTTQAIPLAVSSNYFATVTPLNANGSATGCTEITFSTNTTIAYCAATSTNGTFERINNLSFADINNSSTATTGYEDFTSVIGNVERAGTYTMTATSGANSYSSDQLIAWIDYNQNGIFSDEGERVVFTANSVSPWTGTVTIPETAKLGNTRMRVRVQDTTGNPANATACGNAQYGQVEDYTINIKEKALAVSVTDKASVSVYPNPFSDVLNISDVKGVKSVTITDVAGRQVKSMKASATVNVSDLKTGLYIVTLHMEDGTAKSIKAIKK